MRILLFLGFLALSILVPVGLAQAQSHAQPDLLRAEALVREGKAEEAWKLLSPHEFNLAGREDFDYLLGVAALDTGRADRATLIFERVLAMNPNHAAARLDMARAYFAQGNAVRAKAEFESVLRFNPSQAVRATIDRYLRAIEEGGRQSTTRLSGYVEATLGSDSNVSGSTAQGNVYVPLFDVSFSLAPSSLKARDEYWGMGAGGELSHRISQGVSLIAALDARQRGNFTFDTFDSRVADLRAGVEYAQDRDTFRFLLGTNRYDLDNKSYRRIGSATADWRHAPDALTQYSVFAQGSAIRYVQETTQSNSANQVAVGAGGLRVLDPAGRLMVFASAFGGEENATQGRADGDKRFLGGRIGMQKALRSDADLFAFLSLQHGRYYQDNPLFLARRRDNQYDLNLGVNWQFERNWTLKPQFTYTRTDSNFSIYSYDRYDLSLTLRRDFH